MTGRLLVRPDGGWAVDVPYDLDLLPTLRALPGAWFEKGPNLWNVSQSPDTLAELLSTAAEHGWEVDDEIREAARTAAAEVSERAGGADARAEDPRLYPFQRDGVRWLARRERALLAWDMGTGKTVATLAALPEGAPVLVICPASIKRVWADHVPIWRPEYGVETLSGRGSFRWPEPGEVVVTNPAILPREEDEISDAPAGCVLVADEVQFAKGKSLRSKALRRLARKATRAWGLTGTPLMNRPPELWRVLEVLGLQGEAFGSYGRFRKLFGVRKNRWGDDWSRITVDESVPDLLRRVMLRFRREDVLPDLPAKRYERVVVNDLKAGLRGKLDEALADWESWCEEHGREMYSALPPFEAVSRVRAELATAKTKAALEVVEQHESAEEPLVVFSAHREPVDLIASRDGWVTITGDSSDDQRAEAVRAFQAGEAVGIALTIGAGGEGITLTRASRMLFVDLAWTPASNQQAEDRLCRIGQEAEGLLYTVLVADHPLDERVAELLGAKQDLIDATVEAATVRHAPEDLDEAVTRLEASLDDAAERARQERERKRAAGEIVDCEKCGKEIEVRLSRSAKNPGRPYFSCRPCDWFRWHDEEEGPTIDLGDLRSGGYALDCEAEEQDTAFYQLSRVPEDAEGRWAGWAFLRLQHGPETTKLAAVKPDGTVVGGANAASILERIMADPVGAMSRYGRELGRCGVCGLELTSEESRSLGVGPVCAAKVGIA